MNPSLRPLLSLAGYVALLPLAWWRGWQPGDLAWGLWVAGFVLVGVWLIVMSALLAIETGFDPLRTGGVLVGMAAFGAGLVWVYAFYGEMLAAVFPLTAEATRDFEFWATLATALRQCYGAVVLALLPLLTGLRRDRLHADKFRHAPEFSGASFGRLHVTVLALIGLQIAFQSEPSQHTFWFTAAVLTINFFPWELLDKRKVAELRSLTSHG